MSSTWELSSQTLHVIWSRATGIDLPPRVKKALYAEVFSSLSFTEDVSAAVGNQKLGGGGGGNSGGGRCGGCADGLLDGNDGLDECKCLDFSSFQAPADELENPWAKDEELNIEESVASLLGDVAYDVDVGVDVDVDINVDLGIDEWDGT